MRYILTTLLTDDIDASVSFYQDVLGVNLLERFTNGAGDQIAMLGEEGQPHLELICRKSGARPGDRPLSIGFLVSGEERAIDIVGKIGREYQGPISPNDKLTFYFTTDPDGYRIQIQELKDLDE